MDAPDPSDLNDGNVLVKINCASLSYRDTEGLSLDLVSISWLNADCRCSVCSGTFGFHPSADRKDEPIVPCSDICGTVIKVLRNTAYQEGDRVMAISSKVTSRVK